MDEINVKVVQSSVGVNIHLLPILEGDMNFLGGTNPHVSRLTGQLIVYFTESGSRSLYSTEHCAVRHDREARRLEGNTTMCSPST